MNQIQKQSQTAVNDYEILILGAGEVVAVVQITMLAGLPYTVLRDAILTHPTLAEALGPLFSNVPGKV